MVRFSRLLFVALAAVLIGNVAQAASSYDEPVMTPVPEKPLAGYDGGFILRSPNDDFSLQIMSRIQFQHLYTDIRQAGATDTNTFRLRRARFFLLGKLFERFEFTTFVNHGTSSSSTITTSNGGTLANPNAPFWWGDMTAHIVPEFNMTFGSISLPMDRSGEGSSGKMAFVEPAIVSTQVDGQTNQTISRQAFTAGDTLGIRLWGTLGDRFNYIVGFGNGDESSFFNATRQFAYGARFSVDILGHPSGDESDLAYSETPQFAMGFGGMYEPQNATDSNINFVTLDWSATGSTDIVFQWRGFTFYAEGYARRLKVATGNFSLDDVGYNGQLGYFVVPKKLELVGRGSQIFREGPDNNAWEFAGGINWYIHGHNVKLQSDFSRIQDYDETIGTGGRAANRFRTQLTFQI